MTLSRVDLTWLDGTRALDPGDVGARVATLARLRAAGLPVLRGFVLGRRVFDQAVRGKERGAGGLGQLPREVSEAVLVGLRQLGGPWAVRRSLLGDREERRFAPHELTSTPVPHEPYLHIIDAADVLEAVRRVWERAAAVDAPVAVVVQRFVLADACARVREQRSDELVVEAAYGVGDLLAAGLVVPDRYVIARLGGSIRSRHIGRKSQMTIPSSDGGLVRVPVPVASAREPALSDENLRDLYKIWCEAQGAAGHLDQMSVSVAGNKISITTVAPPEITHPGDDGAMLG
jgi:phosphoenolpyruvate synthase/pyruvate phosphate dikinase